VLQDVALDGEHQVAAQLLDAADIVSSKVIGS
jgi:hypothetical protein